MSCDKKWTVFAVLVSVVVVISIVVPVAVFRNAGQSQAINGQASADGGGMSPSEMFLQFGAMIYCTTKTNPLEYLRYGCQCGWGNGGGKPVDGTDRCCEKHDFCLKNLETMGVCPRGSFLIPYSVKMKGCGKNRTPKLTCKPSHMYKRIENITAAMNPKCAEALCQCDRQAAMCFSNHRLDERYINMDRAMCRQQTSQSPQPTTPELQQPTTPAPQQPSTPAPQQPPTPAQASGPQPIYQGN